MNSSPFQQVEQQLLEPAGLSISDIEKVFSHLKGADLADLYFQSNRFESWSLEDGIISTLHHEISPKLIAPSLALKILNKMKETLP